MLDKIMDDLKGDKNNNAKTNHHKLDEILKCEHFSPNFTM